MIDSNGNIDVTVPLDDFTYGISVGDAIIKLKAAQKGLLQASLEIETEYCYGDYSVNVSVRGKRKATKEEIDRDNKERSEAAAKQRKFEDDQIERLKRTRPEVFK